jgi:hypothetical protein
MPTPPYRAYTAICPSSRAAPRRPACSSSCSTGPRELDRLDLAPIAAATFEASRTTGSRRASRMRGGFEPLTSTASELDQQVGGIS